LDLSFGRVVNENKEVVCSLREQQQGLIDKVTGCSNYIDKYLPVQIHREITRFIHFVLGTKDQDVRGRIDWYDEIKTPLLTSLILCDNGKEALKERTKILHDLTIDRCFNLDGDAKLTSEEKFIATVV